MRLYIIPAGCTNAGCRLNYKTVLSRLAQMLNKVNKDHTGEDPARKLFFTLLISKSTTESAE